MNVRRIVTRAVAILILLSAVGLIAGYEMYRLHVHASGLEAAREWARMSPIPETACGVLVETRGGPFTREFTIRFNAPHDDIRLWLNNSPGTSNLKPVAKGRTRVYTVTPGAGAMHAEVTVDDDADSVVIHTYWS